MQWLSEFGIWIGGGTLLFCVVIAFYYLRKNRKAPSTDDRVNLTIAIGQLPQKPVVTEPFRLEIYGSPVRIRALVLAPDWKRSDAAG